MHIYLDNASTTKPCEEAVNAVVRCATENYGNPSSLHKIGLEAEMEVRQARKTIAKALGCDAERLLFTSGATESNNLAIIGTAEAYGRKKKKIVVSSVEHSCVKQSIVRLEEKGFEVVRISPVDNVFRPQDFINAVDENTFLVSMMLVNNETGYIMPVKQTFSVIKKRFPDVITHCDAVQGFLKIPFKVKDLNADLVSVSGHKVHALKGTGALYIKKGVRVVPQIVGGSQENHQRAGTESVPLIAGFGSAVEKLFPTVKQRYEKVQKLKTLLKDLIGQTDGIEVNSGDENFSPYIISIAADKIRSEIMLHFLESIGIYVSSGSACSKGAKSGVLEEFGIKNPDGTLRISLCEDNTEEDIKALVEGLKQGQATILRK